MAKGWFRRIDNTERETARAARRAGFIPRERQRILREEHAEPRAHLTRRRAA